MRMILKVKQEEFQSEGNALFEKYKVARTEDSLTELKEEKQSSEKSVINYVSKSFEPENRNFANEFRGQRGYSTGFKLGVDQRVKNQNSSTKR